MLPKASAPLLLFGAREVPTTQVTDLLLSAQPCPNCGTVSLRSAHTRPSKK